MKRLITLLIAVFFVGVSYAQNTYKYVINANGGINISGSWTVGGVTITPSGAEINYLDGTIAPIQTQFGLKLAATDTTAMLLKYARKKSPTFTGTVTLPSTTSIGTVSSTEIGYLDNTTSSIQTQINAKANTASPTFTGTVTIPTLTLGATQVTATGAEINTLSGIPATLTATEVGYSDGVTSSIQAQLNTKTTLNGTGFVKASGATITYDNSTYTTSSQATTIAEGEASDAITAALSDAVTGASLFPELADTIPLVTFGIGGGLTADTACFNNGALIGCFYNEGTDTLAITQVMAVLKEGTGTETISVQISWHATMLSGSAVNLNASALSVTSLTTGTADTSFAHNRIPPNVFVWGVLSGASSNNKPTFLSVTVSGFKIPTY